MLYLEYPDLNETFDSILISLAMMAISASAGVLIGVVSPSVLVGVVLVIYGANQISILPAMTVLVDAGYERIFSIGIGAVATAALLFTATILFNRKQF